MTSAPAQLTACQPAAFRSVLQPRLTAHRPPHDIHLRPALVPSTRCSQRCAQTSLMALQHGFPAATHRERSLAPLQAPLMQPLWDCQLSSSTRRTALRMRAMPVKGWTATHRMRRTYLCSVQQAVPTRRSTSRLHRRAVGALGLVRMEHVAKATGPTRTAMTVRLQRQLYDPAFNAPVCNGIVDIKCTGMPV